MNKRIQELAEQAEVQVRLECNNAYWRMSTELPEDGVWQEKFAELIVKECIYTIQRKIVRNGNTPENIRSRQHIIDLGNKFGITFPMDYVGVEE